WWIPANNRSGNKALGATELIPGQCWQTVSGTRGANESTTRGPGEDSVFLWNGTDPTPNNFNGNFGTLDGIWFSIAQDDDGGPYRIYVDELRNGSTLLQNWETAQVQFAQPDASGSTDSGLLLNGSAAGLTGEALARLDSRVISTVNERDPATGHS